LRYCNNCRYWCFHLFASLQHLLLLPLLFIVHDDRYWTRQVLEDGAWHVSEYSAALQSKQQCEPLAMTHCMEEVLSKMSVEVPHHSKPFNV
jgi:hypothetical protein